MKKTCHDDGWPKEDIVLKAENYHEQINKYIYDEIKSYEHTATQIMIVDSALIGIYLAIVMNSQSIEAIRIVLNSNPIIKIPIYVVLLSPFFSWVLCMIFCCIVLYPRVKNIEESIDGYKLLNSFITIKNLKNKWIRWSYASMIFGAMIIFVLTGIAIHQETLGFSEIWKTKGDEILLQDRYNESISVYDKAIEINKQNIDALNNKGIALSALGKYNEAITCYDEAIKLDPQSASPWYNKGKTLSEQGKYGDAITCYDEALKIDEQFAEAWHNKGIALRALGKYDDAIKAYDKAIKINGQYKLAWHNKGNALNAFGKYDDAIACYDEAIKIDEQFAEAWHNKGISLNNVNRVPEAETCFARAKELGYTDKS